MKTNNYKKSMEIINSQFQVKGVKTFEGMEGYGINANLYFEGKKVAFILDEGNGGCLDVRWDRDKGYRWNDNPLIPLMKTLPKTTYLEVYGKDECDLGEYKWDEESVCNCLVDEYLAKQEFKKCLKKVSVLLDDNTIATYKANASDLDATYNLKEGKITFREYVLKDKSVKTILNDLPLDDAFNVYMKNREVA